MRNTLFCLLLLPLASFAEEVKKDESTGTIEAASLPTNMSHEASVTIDGKKIDYAVTSGALRLETEKQENRAHLFYFAYTREAKDTSQRPVVFAFNGGPGSSAVWLHLGALGPKIVPTTEDGTETLPPPITLRDNPWSILDVADLVFIDPVSTGYSRAGEEAKPADFHGLEADIQSVGDFIRLWTTQNKRWSSPKYLLGESYGGIRAAGLAEHLQDRYGMTLNGVVLLSSLLDFRTLKDGPGDDLMHLVYLPAYAATAHYHKKIDRPRDELLAEARALSSGPYATALLAGDTLLSAEKQQLAKRLSSLTAIPTEIWLENHLRIAPSRFRRELLRDQDLIIGRFDGRVAWPAQTESYDYPTYDPSYSVIYGAFSTAMNDYLTSFDYNHYYMPYEILSSKVRPWKWNSENRIVNVAERLQKALRDNPDLRILVMGGLTDLATPPTGMEHSLNHLLDLPPSAREKISTTTYESGHMFYLNEPDLIKMRKDLVKFIKEQD